MEHPGEQGGMLNSKEPALFETLGCVLFAGGCDWKFFLWTIRYSDHESATGPVKGLIEAAHVASCSQTPDAVFWAKWSEPWFSAEKNRVHLVAFLLLVVRPGAPSI